VTFGNNATVMFNKNTATQGGAVYFSDIFFDENSRVTFSNNRAWSCFIPSYSTLTPQIKGNHRVIYVYIIYNPDHRVMISYYHPWSVFRADSPDLCLGLIALTTQVSNIY